MVMPSCNKDDVCCGPILHHSAHFNKKKINNIFMFLEEERETF